MIFIKIQKNTQSLPTLIRNDNNQTEDPNKIVDMLNAYFGSVFIKSVVYPSNINTSFSENVDLSECSFSLAKVFENLCKLGSDINPGPDGIPALLFKERRYSIACPIHYIISPSLGTSSFPNCWKYSHVYPIFKSGDRLLISNYRPINKFCVLSKLFDKIMELKLF